VKLHCLEICFGKGREKEKEDRVGCGGFKKMPYYKNPTLL